MASARIFISYRREDSAAYAGRLADRIADRLGRSHVFRDIAQIRPGENFVNAIREKINRSNVLLVLIGPHWLTVADAQGNTRLRLPDDLVRHEIEMGLERKLQLIPVLLPAAAMPAADQLPPSIAPIAQHNAFEIRENSFDRDVAHLLSAIKHPPRSLLPDFVRNPIFLVGVIAVLVAILFGSIKWLHPAFLMTRERARTQLAESNLKYDPESFVEAAGHGDSTAVSLFLRAGMDPNERLGDYSALDMALRKQHFDIAKLLIQGGADPGIALRTVARYDNQELFDLVLSHKPKPNDLVGALHVAADTGEINFVRKLLDSGVSPNATWYGSTSLSGAAYFSRLDVVKLLLERGADVNAVDHNSGGRGETALHYATRAGDHPEVVQALLQAHASVNAQDQSGTTPLMNALDYKDVASLLLAAGADVKIRTKSGETALIYAAGGHLPEMVKLLIHVGADVNARNDREETALMWTSGAIDLYGNKDVAQILIDSGAQMNLTDQNGWTALMWAAHKNATDPGRILIAAGANKEIRSKNGHTALQIALADGCKEMVALLSGSRATAHG